MIFRRSLVRELTATAIGLFLVLLAILFTNLVLRLLARAAGGAVAPDGILALLGFNALFYLNILLSVALFLTVLLTLSRWYRDSEMIVWFTSGQSLTACLRPILLFAAPFLVAIVVLSLYLSPWAEQRKLEYERQLESRDDIARRHAGAVPRVPAREPRRVRRKHQSVRQHDPQRLPALGRGQAGRDHRRARAASSRTCRTATASSCSRTAAATRASPARPTTASSSSRSSAGASSRPRCARCRRRRKAIPTAALLASNGRVERAELFWRISVPISALVLTLLAVPLAYVNPRMGRSFNLVAAAFLYMLYSNCLNIVQSLIAQGKLELWAGLLLPHVIALLVVVVLFRHQLSVTGLFARARAGGSTADRLRAARCSASASAMKTLQRYIGRDVLLATLLIFAALIALFAFFDLIHELGDVGRGDYTISRALLFVTLQPAVAPLRALPGRRADRHAVRHRAARRQFRVHGDARVGHVARAGDVVGAARRHSAGRRDVPRRRIRRAAGGAPCADGARRRARRVGASSRSSSSPASGSSRT